jgi:hypothetical protein
MRHIRNFGPFPAFNVQVPCIVHCARKSAAQAQLFWLNFVHVTFFNQESASIC